MNEAPENEIRSHPCFSVFRFAAALSVTALDLFHIGVEQVLPFNSLVSRSIEFVSLLEYPPRPCPDANENLYPKIVDPATEVCSG